MLTTSEGGFVCRIIPIIIPTYGIRWQQAINPDYATPK
jgi:hypothetical protein